MQSLVTVIIPVYNRERTIKRSIDSVLAQSYANIELIIVDDGSSDGTLRVVNSYQDRRMKLICLNRNSGANVARNIGISVAQGEYIAFQDSDDEWMKDKLEIQIKYLESTGNKVCYCPYFLCRNKEIKIIPRHPENKELYEEQIQTILRKKNVISTQTLVIHKEVVKTVGIFDETLRRLQDYEFVIRVCQHYKIGYIEKPLVNVYRMNDSISNNKPALIDSYKKILVRHIDFVDFESFLRSYLFNCEWYDTKKIYWTYLDEILEIKEKRITAEKKDLKIKIKKEMSDWYDFFKQNIVGGKFVIYGAGYYGEEVYYTLKKMGIIPQYFWITHREKEDRIDHIPVLELPDQINEGLSVLIAINREGQEEMCQNLFKRKFSNFYVYPFC